MQTQTWIKATLKAKGFKLKDMAEALGITAPRVTDILRGTREVQSHELDQLAGLLDLSLKSLLASLQKGELTELPESGDRLPVLGRLLGDGSLLPIASKGDISTVALPPDLNSVEGLYCYVMGDNSMAQEIKPGDIIIAADPRVHFYPMVPGALFIVRRASGKTALRQYLKNDSGEGWLVPLPIQPNPEFSSWRFDMLPAALSSSPAEGTSGEAGSTGPTNADRETQGNETVRIADIFAAVLWVQRRYMPEASA